jgi:hypothetical protein
VSSSSSNVVDYSSSEGANSPQLVVETASGSSSAQKNADPSLNDARLQSNSLASLPEQMELGPNYPNPFNPETSVQYAVISEQWVSLKVYNVLGKEVATLVNKKQREIIA